MISSLEIAFEVGLPFDFVVLSSATGFPRTTGPTEFVLANHPNNSENVPSLEVLPRISSHFPIHSEYQRFHRCKVSLNTR